MHRNSLPTLCRRNSDATVQPVSTRSRAIAEELKAVIRLAGRDPEALEGKLPELSALHPVCAAGELDEPARVHLILHRLIPGYLERLPAGRDCRAIRELMTWEDADGDFQSLTTRYHKAAAHLVNAASDFGRRQEPRLLAECARRFIAFDHEDRLAGAGAGAVASAGVADPAGPNPVAGASDPADGAPAGAGLVAIAAAAALPAGDPLAGIVRVHRNLDYHLLVDLMAGADEIVILNTWIPELNILADALVDALERGTYVSILMLYPDSHVAQLRSDALQGSTQVRFREDRVKPGVKHCLEVLAAITRSVDHDLRRHLRVRLYHSLPSLSIYGVDDRAFVSVFLHGQLAVKSVQIEVQGQDSVMGRLAFGELEALWEIGLEFGDITQWETEIESMGRHFGLAP